MHKMVAWFWMMGSALLVAVGCGPYAPCSDPPSGASECASEEDGGKGDNADAQAADAANNNNTANDTGDPLLATSFQALTSNNFLFAHPLQGSGSYTRACNFNTTACYSPGKYHTAVDELSSSQLTIRAANFGRRSLTQMVSTYDHGMGNAYCNEFLLDSGVFTYNCGNHLANLQTQAVRPNGRAEVPKGAKQGEMGGSGYGLLMYWVRHLHDEYKTLNTLANACGSGTYYGYTPSSALNFCYQNPDTYYNTRRVLMPEFSTANSGWGDYDTLYGVAGQVLWARLQLVGAPRAYTKVGVGGRAGWGGTVVDFPMVSAPVGNSTYTQSKTLTAGDYRFFAAVQDGTIWRTGYELIFTVLPKATDFIRDNDMGSSYFTSGGLGVARYDGYGYGAHAATGNSGAWARWFTQNAGTYSVWAFVGGQASGTVRFKLYPTGSGTPIYSDPINLASFRWQWVQLKVGTTSKWAFTTSGYVGLSADAGNASDTVLFDAMKFIAQ